MRFVVIGLLVVVGVCATAAPALAESAAGAWVAPSSAGSSVSLDERSYAPRTDWVWCAEPIVASNGGYAACGPCPPLRPAPKTCWRGVIAAYVWASSVSGTSWANGVESDIDLPFGDLVDKLDYAFMGYGEIAYDRWSFAIDATTLALEDSSVTPTLGIQVDTELEQVLIDLRLGYSFLRREIGGAQWGACCYPRHLMLDGVVGARYWNLDQTLALTLPTGASGSGGDEESWWDPYVGARLRWQFAKRWGLTVYGDLGGFDIGDASEFTWQIQTILRFSITRRLFVALGYRALGVDRVTGSGSSRNGVDATYHGPMLGIGYMF